MGKIRGILKRVIRSEQLESESMFLRWVCDYARLKGWWIYHPLPGRGRQGEYLTLFYGHAGFPDLVLCRPPRLIFAELKTVRGRLSENQQEWRNRLEQIEGVEYYLWRPTDREKIIEVLK